MLARAVEPEMARDPERTGIAVVLRVEQVVTLAGEVLQGTGAGFSVVG
jgi:hypothetical protein